MQRLYRSPENGLSGHFNYQTGAETVEFLITLPVALLVLAILFDFGVAFSDQTILANATRAAAREVIQGGSDAQAQQAADLITQSLMSRLPADPLPTVTVNRTGLDAGDPASISLSHQFGFFLLPSFLSDVTNIQLTATTVMRMLPN
ncbi:MAG: TadE/TadG family type IV pilus assembly protein [Chromatiales bacterium]|jgi:Flp pilus assembly protein TadG